MPILPAFVTARRAPNADAPSPAGALPACRWLALGLLLAVAPSCALTRVGATERRIVELERTRDAIRVELDAERKRLVRLHTDSEESSSYLRENGARFSARMDMLERKITQTAGSLEELANALQAITTASGQQRAAIESLDRRLRDLIGDLRDRAGIAILALPRDLPEHADDWVKLAQLRFDEGEVRVADAVARECRKRFPGTDQAGHCGLVIGRIAYEEQRFGDAIDLLRAVHDDLGGKAVPVVAQALLQIGEVMEAQGKCKESKQILEYLRTLMMRGREADLAKERSESQKGRCEEGKAKSVPPTSGSKRPGVAEGLAPSPGAQATRETKAPPAAVTKPGPSPTPPTGQSPPSPKP